MWRSSARYCAAKLRKMPKRCTRLPLACMMAWAGWSRNCRSRIIWRVTTSLQQTSSHFRTYRCCDGSQCVRKPSKGRLVSRVLARACQRWACGVRGWRQCREMTLLTHLTGGVDRGGMQGARDVASGCWHSQRQSHSRLAIIFRIALSAACAPSQPFEGPARHPEILVFPCSTGRFGKT
jgi:hypothetical protein